MVEDGADAASQSSSASAMANQDSELVEGDEEPLSVPDTSEVRLCNISTTHLLQMVSIALGVGLLPLWLNLTAIAGQ